MYKAFIRPIFFKFDPEKIHHFTFSMLQFYQKIGLGAILGKLYKVKDARLERELFGLKFPNPVGLAAGFDKDAKLYRELSNLGFGFVEIGTVTPKPQAGNKKPRLFRLQEDSAVINRMGFNNGGVKEAVERLKQNPKGNRRVLIGGNIGKNKTTPNENAVDDYLICFEALYDCVDYFVVNVSSPNTPGLRELQEKEPLTRLLQSLNDLNATKSQRRPILLKIAPDLTDQQLDDIVEIVKDTGIDGLIATNTTISRDSLITPESEITAIDAGGLSGKPLRDRSTEVIRYLRKAAGPDLPIIGVGGIHSADDAIEKLKSGANLIQIYSGFVYEGPGL